jgi:molybdopterin-binding protein
MRRKRNSASGMRFRNGYPIRLLFGSRGAVAWHITLRNTMRISARNQIKGKILDVKKGATTAHIRLEIAPGQVITSSITNEAVDDLGLKVGATATAVIKASDVMIAID